MENVAGMDIRDKVLNDNLGSVNDTYRGLHQWFKDDLEPFLESQRLSRQKQGQAEPAPNVAEFQNNSAENKGIQNQALGSVNDSYLGLHQWFKDDLRPYFLQNEKGQSVTSSETKVMNGPLGSVNETYRGLHQRFKDDLLPYVQIMNETDCRK